MIEKLERLLAQGQDNALLRFGLGNEFLKAGNAEKAVEHLRMAVVHDANYSAAWKVLGKALDMANRPAEAIEAYERGIEVAEKNGDKQAAKEMTVFLKRLRQA